MQWVGGHSLKRNIRHWNIVSGDGRLENDKPYCQWRKWLIDAVSVSILVLNGAMHRVIRRRTAAGEPAPQYITCLSSVSTTRYRHWSAFLFFIVMKSTPTLRPWLSLLLLQLLVHVRAADVTWWSVDLFHHFEIHARVRLFRCNTVNT